MVLPSSAVLRTAAQQLARPAARAGFRSAGRQQPFQRIAQSLSRRAYSSSHGGHGGAQAKSDLPWLIGSVAFTIPATWWALQPGAAHHAAHDDHHEETHEEKHEEPKQEEPKEEEAPKEEPKQDEEPKDEPKEESKEESKDDAPKEDESKDESKEQLKGDSDGPRAKGATSAGEDHKAPDTRSSTDDAKEGASKKRIDSDYRKEIGNEGSKADAEGSAKDKPSPNKEPLSQNQTSGKQEGLSNTDTRHSTDPGSDPSKSKKPEGGPDTAKAKGPIDPKRPAV